MTTSLLYDTEATPTSAPLQTPEIPHANSESSAPIAAPEVVNPTLAEVRNPTGTDALLGAHSADEYTSLMHNVVDALGERFRTTERAASAKDRSGLQAAVDAVDLDTAGVGNAEALREVDALYADNAVWFHHPSYVAHLNCPVAVPAVAAEAMLAAINTSVDTYDQSEVATLMERRLIDWACGHLGFAGGDGIFTSGGTQSNLHCSSPAKTSSPGLPNAPTNPTVVGPMTRNLAEAALTWASPPAVTSCPVCGSSLPIRLTSPCPVRVPPRPRRRAVVTSDDRTAAWTPKRSTRACSPSKRERPDPHGRRRHRRNHRPQCHRPARDHRRGLRSANVWLHRRRIRRRTALGPNEPTCSTGSPGPPR